MSIFRKIFRIEIVCGVILTIWAVGFAKSVWQRAQHDQDLKVNTRASIYKGLNESLDTFHEQMTTIKPSAPTKPAKEVELGRVREIVKVSLKVVRPWSDRAVSYNAAKHEPSTALCLDAARQVEKYISSFDDLATGKESIAFVKERYQTMRQSMDTLKGATAQVIAIDTANCLSDIQRAAKLYNSYNRLAYAKPSKPIVRIVEVERRRVESSPISRYGNTNDYLSDTRLVENYDCAGKSDWDLDIMRNEIYARHGRMFIRNDLQSYFNQQSWYVPDSRFRNSWLSNLEQQNANRILNYQKKGTVTP